MAATNRKLKAAIITVFGTQTEGARQFEIREDRLSRIIHRRVKPSVEEQRVIALRLQKPMGELFAEA
jgi:hypothetical protein